MFTYIKILMVCTLAGGLLASLFVGPDGAAAGATKGFLIGTLIVWAEWKFNHSAPDGMEALQGDAEGTAHRAK